MRSSLFTILALCACEADSSPAPPSVPIQPESQIVEYALAVEPVFAIGLADGPEEYLFRDIAGAVRLGNGDVVVAVRGYHEVRRFGPDGRHLWTSGRQGNGPGEFQYLNLLQPCTNESSIVVHDSYNHFVTTFDSSGAMVSTDRFERFPWGLGLTCAPGGRLAFSDWSDAQSMETTYRWTNGLAYADAPDSRIRVLEEALPGDERFNVIQNGRIAGEGPRPWGKSLVFAPTDDGVWYATGDTYELALLGWSGEVVRRIRWEGPDRRVTAEHRDNYRRELCRRYEDEENREELCNNRFARDEPFLPSEFPSISRLLVGRDGRLWVEYFRRPFRGRQWVVFGTDGTWVSTLRLSARMSLQDAGPDWILVRRYTDDLDVEVVEIYPLAHSP